MLPLCLLGIVACGSDIVDPPPGGGGGGGGGVTYDGTYALQSVQGVALPASVEASEGVLVFTDGSMVLGQGSTWNLTINFTRDGDAFVLRHNGVYEAPNTALMFHCGENATFQGTIQAGVLELAYDQDCDGEVDLTLTFGPPPPMTNGVVGTYELITVGLCEAGTNDPCGPGTPQSRLPFCVGSGCAVGTGGSAIHSGEITLNSDGTWRLFIEKTGLLGDESLRDGGEYSTRGTDITFIRDGCRDMPHRGTLQGTELRLVIPSFSCSVGGSWVMTFRR